MYNQYPPNTTGVYSYIESRGGAWEKTLFFGLQIFIKDYLTKPITKEDITIADEILTAHGVPFYRAGWEYILDKHNGYLPLRIRAVPEGTILPTSNVLVTIEATDTNCFWLTTQAETALLRAVWYPTTVATLSRSIKDIILPYLNLTGDPAGINFKLHDFGARGGSSMESVGIGGAAHLVNFMGTDNITGLLYAREYYDAGVAGFSIPAMEHSTVTSWGRDREVDAYRNMLKNYAKPGAILACVSDSYDVFNAAEKLWGEELRQEVIDSGAVVVIRPDSGDPVEVNIKLIEILGSKFGYIKNSKGYKVLNHVRLIQGDGVNENTIESILHTFEVNGWSADNIAFGMGGALLQGVVRDTAKFAMKCSSACIDDVWEDVQKDPITDSGKRSKKGRIELWECGGEYQSSIEKPTNWADRGVEWKPVLETIFENGKLVKEYTFDEIRNRSNE